MRASSSIEPRRLTRRTVSRFRMPRSRGVLAVDLDVGVRQGAMQRRDALRHRARTPVLEHGAGREPERILAVRRLGGRLVGPEPDPRPMVGMAVEVEGAAAAIGGGVVGGDCSATGSRGRPRRATSRPAARAARRWEGARSAAPHGSGRTPPRSARRDGAARRGRASRSRGGARPRSSARRRWSRRPGGATIRSKCCTRRSAFA